ncbi:hypothetical protein Tco_0167740 [Tanacetum coccineum]
MVVEREEVADKDMNLSVDERTLAHALAKLERSARVAQKDRAQNGNVFSMTRASSYTNMCSSQQPRHRLRTRVNSKWFFEEETSCEENVLMKELLKLDARLASQAYKADRR